MFIVETATGNQLDVVVEPIEQADLKGLTKRRFAFNWKAEKNVFKLREVNSKTILGVMSIGIIPGDQRVEVNLLAVSKENVGHGKAFDRIAGNLLAYAGRVAITEFGENAAVSLIPKTNLGQHYMNAYGFEQVGRSLFMEGHILEDLVNRYL